MKRKAKEIINEINNSAVSKTPVPAKKIISFITEAENQAKILSEAATILMENGFGPDDDDAQFDIVSMLKSAISDIQELRNENKKLQAQIGNSKIFEQTLNEG